MSLVRKRSLGIVLVGVVVTLGVVLAGFSWAEVEAGREERLVAIHDRGARRVVRVTAGTVGEVLDIVSVEIGEGDRVEPGLDGVIAGHDFNINIFRARPVLVVDGMSKTRVMTAAQTAEDIVGAAGVELLDQDEAEVRIAHNLIEAGTNIEVVVLRSRMIRLNFYGALTEVRTRAGTVGEFLDERGIGVEDFVSKPRHTPIEDGMELEIWRNGANLVVVEEEIDFSVEQVRDFDRERGYRRVTEYGQVGKRLVTYEVEMQDGVEVSRRMIEKIVVREPRTQREVIGMRVNLPVGSHEDWMRAAGIAEADFGFVNFIVQRESGWNPLARNPSSGAFGLCQALPGNRMASAGPDWETNPITQLRWCNEYAHARYYDGSIFLRGSQFGAPVSCSGLRRGWECAYAFWLVNRWW